MVTQRDKPLARNHIVPPWRLRFILWQYRPIHRCSRGGGHRRWWLVRPETVAGQPLLIESRTQTQHRERTLSPLPFSLPDTPPFPSRMTVPYRPPHENMDAATRQPGEDHHRQVRRAQHSREQRVPANADFHDERNNGHHVMPEKRAVVMVGWWMLAQT